MDTNREGRTNALTASTALLWDAADAVPDGTERSADCCGARATVRVGLPATGELGAAELLFCSHHYRIHSAARERAGAVSP